MGFNVPVYGEEKNCLEVVRKCKQGIYPAFSPSVKSRWKKEGPPLEGATRNAVLSEERRVVSGNKKIKITFKKRLKIRLTSLMPAPEDTWCWGEVENGSKRRNECTEPS